MNEDCRSCKFVVAITRQGEIAPDLFCFWGPPQVVMIPVQVRTSVQAQMAGQPAILTTMAPRVTRPPCPPGEWCYRFDARPEGEPMRSQTHNPVVPYRESTVSSGTQ